MPPPVSSIANRDAHGDFDQAAAIDLSGKRKGLRAAAGPGAERGERLGAVTQDPRHTGRRLDIVDDGGLAAKTAFHRVRRPQFGRSALGTVQTVFAHRAHVVDGAVGARFGAQPAVEFFVRRDGDSAAGQPRAPRKQAAIRAQVAAVGPSHEHAGQQKAPAQHQHVGSAGAAKESDERVKPAD
jgi:hypothetical protein